MTAHIEIRETDAEQPFHVVIVGGNGEPILAGENLASEADAMVAVCAVAAMFGWVDARLVHGTTEPWEWHVIDGANTRSVPVHKVDQRVPEVPC